MNNIYKWLKSFNKMNEYLRTNSKCKGCNCFVTLSSECILHNCKYIKNNTWQIKQNGIELRKEGEEYEIKSNI